MSMKRISGYTIFLGKILGKGSYGEVFVGEQDGTKKACAVKMIKKSNSKILGIIQLIQMNILNLLFFQKLKCLKL